MQELEWGKVLGLATTWPQAAGIAPSRETTFDWQGTRPLHLPREDLIIYEMHVRGFTQSPTSSTTSPGAQRHPAFSVHKVVLIRIHDQSGRQQACLRQQEQMGPGMPMACDLKTHRSHPSAAGPGDVRSKRAD